MKISYIFKLLLIPFIVSLFGFLLISPAKASAFILSGKVTDNTGAVISGTSKIDVFNIGTTTDAVPPTTTNSSGNYSFTNLSGGTYDIQVTPPSGSGFGSAIALGQNITGDTTLNFVLVPISSTVKVTGQIVDNAGHGVQNFYVNFYNTVNSSLSTSVPTDTNGNYTANVSTTGSYNIKIVQNGLPGWNYSANSCTTTFSQDTIMNTIAIPFQTVNVLVQDSTNTIVANTTVNTSGQASSPITVAKCSLTANNITTYTQTNLSGIAQFQLPTGTYSFSAGPTGIYGSATVNNVSVTSGTNNVVIILPTNLTVSGRIVDSSGIGLSQMGIDFNNTTSNSLSTQTQTDSNGYYTAHVSSTGSYSFRVTDSSLIGWSYVSQDSCSKSFSQNTVLSDIVIPYQKVSVLVQNSSSIGINNVNVQANGTASSPIAVNGCSLINSGVISYANTNSSGLVSLHIPTGIYSFSASPSDTTYTSTNVTGIAINPTSTSVVITLPTTITVKGRVVDGLGAGLSNMYVSFINPTNTNLNVSVPTDSNGYYTAHVSSSGNYDLQISDNSLPGWHYASSSCGATFSQNTTLNDIVVPYENITVHVQNANNIAIPNVSISASGKGSNTIIAGSCSLINTSGIGTSNFPTDQSGNAALRLPPGIYNFYAYPTGGLYSPFTLTNISISTNQTEIISLQYSHVGPVTTATLSPAADSQGNYQNPTKITLSAVAANGFTVANTYYTIDGSSQQTYSSTFTISGFGNHTITYWSVDNVGVTESVNTKTFLINALPIASAGGPYSIAEGGSLPLQGSATDPDGDTLTYSWDFTGGTNFTIQGQAPIFQAGSLDGPSSQQVNLQVCDNHGACSTSFTTVNIFPVVPVLGNITAPTTPVIVNSSISPSVIFTDSGPADTHTAIWDYGDGQTGNGTVNEGTQTVTGSHTYTKAGVYTLQITLTDDDSQTETQIFQYVVVYDPSAGFVTGGGNINSPAGAEPVLPNATGPANFGISAKYTSTNTAPTGNTMFTFPNGGFDFTSTSYDWLVVNGSTAFLHGKGTINGAGNYTFLVSALSGSPDKLRVKITDSSNTVLYDNQMGASETTPPTKAISNGQIKIH